MAPLQKSASDEAGFKRLVELEAEYRTQRPPDQLYAIASFPRLFDEFPYPVIINAGILKLADYFRQSNNIQRHAILQVFMKSQTHLKKVINVEETIKRISPMLQSTDPLARAITLRVLGGMATIVSDRIDVYHKVIHSLDSSEAMEVSAAVYAADMICSQSQRFCAIFSGKLAFMVRDTTKTPLPLRRRLIRIFGHMFGDITLARLARKTCLDILELSQDTEYTIAILKTLTRLASHSLVDVNQQIDLLLQWTKDSRPGIRRVSLTCLGLLAQKNIEFSPNQIQAIFNIASNSKDGKTVLKAMLAIHKIFHMTCAITSISLTETGAETIKGYIQTCLQILERSFSSDSLLESSATATTAATAVAEPGSSTITTLYHTTSWSKPVVLECYSVLTVLLPYCHQFNIRESFSETEAGNMFNNSTKTVTQSMKQFLICILSQGGGVVHGVADGGSKSDQLSSENVAQARIVLWSLLVLTIEEGSGIDDLLETVLEWVVTYTDSSTLLARALLQIARQQPRKASAFHSRMVKYLEDNVDTPDTQTFILVYRALLESTIPSHGVRRSSGAAVAAATTATTTAVAIECIESFEMRMTRILEQFGKMDMLEHYTRNHWELYQLARYSLQTGWPSLALVALKNQEKNAKSVSSSLWLMTEHTMALIESSLQSGAAFGDQDDSERLDLCPQKQMYTKVISCLEELEAHQVDRSFHLHYCELRRRYLDTCQSTIGTLRLLSMTLSSERLQEQQNPQIYPEDELALYQCADQFNSLAHEYTVLRTCVAPAIPSTSTSTSSSSTLGFTLASAKRPLSSGQQQSDGAIEVLQTMCLVVAYAIQRAAKVLGNYGSSAKSKKLRLGQTDTDTDMDGDADVFDIDPLLIPLLYLQNQKQQQQRHGSQSGEGGSKSILEAFKISTGMMLGFMNKNMVGSGIDDIERSISLVRQFISSFISFPIPIPQEFFVSSQSKQAIST